MHKLPDDYRIRVNGNNEYKIQKKGWFFWSDWNSEYWGSWGGGGYYCKTFFSKEDACKYVMKRVEEAQFSKKWHKQHSQWKDAGPC